MNMNELAEEGGLANRAQINEVLRNLNVSATAVSQCQIREGLFSDQDLHHLDNGYSVSETDIDDFSNVRRAF